MSGVRWTPEQLSAHKRSPATTAQKRFQALGRMKAGAMNKTEARYAEHLEQERRAGEIQWFAFEPMTFKIAPDTRITPDFMVLTADGYLEAHDVKGSRAIVTDDAKVKLKVMAATMPVRVVLVYPVAAKNGGGWDIQEVGA